MREARIIDFIEPPISVYAKTFAQEKEAYKKIGKRLLNFVVPKNLGTAALTLGLFAEGVELRELCVGKFQCGPTGMTTIQRCFEVLNFYDFSLMADVKSENFHVFSSEFECLASNTSERMRLNLRLRWSRTSPPCVIPQQSNALMPVFMV
ncbi:hypothetical protein D3C87_1419050 [compost metagenome]